jgi:hypothetical protein
MPYTQPVPEPLSIASSIGQQAVRSFLARRRAANERTLPLAELINVTTLDDHRRRQLKREVETIVDVIDRRLDNFIDTEWKGLPKNDRSAVVAAVADTFNAYDLSDSALFAVDADPISLAKRIRSATTGRAQLSMLGADAAELYSRLLDESCLLYTQLVVSLAPFVSRTVAELLVRTSSLSQQVEFILQRLPVGTLDAPEGTAHDAEFRSRYLAHISAALDYIELFGIDINRYRPSATLTVAYISLSVTNADARTGSNTAEVDKSDEDRLDGEQELEDAEEDLIGQASMKIESALASSDRILVRGEAGSGKTTLLSWLAVTAARGAFTGPLATWNNKIPFLIRLRGYVGAVLPSPENYLAGTADVISGIMPRGWVHRKLMDGSALLLVDGVDELPASQRRAVRAWLSSTLKEYPQSTVVVTARLAAASSEWLASEGFSSVVYDRMSPADTKALIAHWHNAMRDSGNLPCDERELPSYERDLLSKLDSTPHLRALATNPLLCAMLCALNLDRHKALPPDRMAVYKAALNMLLERRDVERGLTPEPAVTIDLDDKLQLLQYLAWRLSLNGRTEIDKKQAIARFGERLRSMNFVDAKPDKIIDYLISRSGVIREPVIGRVDFVHRTFQEYLTAREAAEQGDIGLLVERAHLDTWQDTIIMAVGHANRPTRTELFESLLRRTENVGRHTRRIKLLTAACLETSGPIDPDLRAKIEECLTDLVPPRRMSEARSLVIAGRIVLRLAPRDSASLSPTIACAMAWTVGVLGGPGALDILSGYASDDRRVISRELLKLCRYFDPKEFADRVLSKIPPSSFPLMLNDRSQVTCIRYLKDARISAINLWNVTDLSEDLRDLPPFNTLWVTGSIADASILEHYSDTLSRVTLRSNVPLASFEPLNKLPKLSSLNIFYPALTDVAFVSRLARLNTLGLSEVTGECDLWPLSSQEGLRSLRLNGQGKLPSLEFLRTMHNVEVMLLFNAEPSGGIEALAGLMPQLKRLNVHDGDWINDLSPLEGLTHLTDLTVVSKNVHDLGPLGALKSIRRLELNCPGVTDLTILRQLPNLRYLTLTVPFGAELVETHPLECPSPRITIFRSHSTPPISETQLYM